MLEIPPNQDVGIVTPWSGSFAGFEHEQSLIRTYFEVVSTPRRVLPNGLLALLSLDSLVAS